MSWVLLLFVFVGTQGGMSQSSTSFESQPACEMAIVRAKAELEGVSRHGSIRVYGTCNHVSAADNFPLLPRPR